MSVLKVRSVREYVFFAAVSMQVDKGVELIAVDAFEFSSQLFEGSDFGVSDFVLGVERPVEVVSEVV